MGMLSELCLKVIKKQKHQKHQFNYNLVTPNRKLYCNKLKINTLESNIKIPAKSRKGGVKTAFIFWTQIVLPD